MDVEVLQKPLGGLQSDPINHPNTVGNRQPTAQDLLELSSRIYKSSRKLYNEADSQGMRVYHDELIAGDVRLVMIVPSWFPKAHVTFDWDRLQGDEVSVVFVIRGTMQDLIGNTKANLQLLFNKLIDDQHLPDVAADATKVIQAWLRELLLRHPALDSSLTPSSSSSSSSSRHLHLDVHVTGHSLGGLLAEVATVESYGFAATHGASWKCTSFESPGVPDFYHSAALRMAGIEYWNEAITGYLAAPNPINMLYCHLGHVVHVVVPWEQTWSHVAKCVGADVARVTAWAIVGGMVIAGMKQLTGVQRQQQQDDEAAGGGGLLGAAGAAIAEQCPAVLPSQIGGFLPRTTEASLAPALSAAAAAPARPAAVTGPVIPGPLLFTVAETGPAAARTLTSIGTGIVDAGVAAAAAAANSATNSASPQATLTAAAISAAAAASEAAANIGRTKIMQHIARRSGLGVLANVVAGWVFGRSGIMGVVECLAGVLGVEVEELIAQHALCPMRQCFDPHTGQLKARYRRDMVSWPHLGHRRKVLLAAAQQVAKWTLPSFVCRDNVGVANLLSRTAMVEARCARLDGYVLQQDATEQQEEVDAVFFDSESDRRIARELDTLQLPLLPDQQRQQHGAAADVFCSRLQQQQQVAPRGLGSGLPGIGRQRLPQPQSQQRLPRRLLRLQPSPQQQQHDDVVMWEAAEAGMQALEALDAAELGAAADPASATAAAARLCSGLQCLQAGLRGSDVSAHQLAQDMELDAWNGLSRANTSAGAAGISIRIEGRSSGPGGLQNEVLVETHSEAGLVVLDDADDGSMPQLRRQRQAMLLPGL